MNLITKAILPVGGLGTRFLPATKAQPKEMLPIVDKPVIQFLVEEAVQSGIKEIIFVTGQGKRAIEDHFDYALVLEQALSQKGKKDLLKQSRAISNLARFSYVRQREPRGNGDAILMAEHLIGDEPFAVLFGDDLIFNKVPALQQMMDVYEKYGDPVVSLEKVAPKDVEKYGIVDGTKINSHIFEIHNIIEKPKRSQAPSNYSVTGKYIVTPEIFRYIKKLKNSDGEIGLTDALGLYAHAHPVYGCIVEGVRHDCGSKIGYLRAIVDYGLTHPETKTDFKRFLKKQASKL